MAFDLESASSQDLTNLNGVGVIDADTLSIAITFMVESRSGTDILYYSAQDLTSEANRGLTLNVVAPAAGDWDLFIVYNFSTSLGQWKHDTTLSFNTFYRIVVTYDRSSTTNDPILYIDGTKNTVGSGLLEDATPSGTATTGLDSIRVGSYESGFLYADCRVAELAHWTRILSDGEALAISKGYSPAFFRPVTYWDFIRGLTDQIGGVVLTNNNSATVTPHPAVIYPTTPRPLVAPPVVAGVGIRNPFGGPMSLRNPLGA